ncbi:MAG: M56 family metallopeptidase [Ignavibacteriota bacterium]
MAWISIFLGAALKSTVVLGAAWLLTRTLRQRSAATRHLVWTGATAALLALPLLFVSMPKLAVPTGSLAPLVSSITFRTSAVAARDAVQPKSALPNPSLAPIRTRQPIDLRLAIPLLWAVGAALALAQLAAAWMVMWRMRRTARPLIDSPWHRPLAEALQIRRPVALLEIPAGGMPLSFGILSPAVFLPADARQWE